MIAFVSPREWREDLAGSFRSPAHLFSFLQLPPQNFHFTKFPLLVPRFFAEKMEKGNAHDPLLLQVLPQQREEELHPLFSTDPVGDLAAGLKPGILRKYQGRILLITTGACALHCRYCFRRNYTYEELPKHQDQLVQLADNAAQLCDKGGEIVFSGGDPFMLSDETLLAMIAKIRSHSHVGKIRFHTRMSTQIPRRFHRDFLTALAKIATPWVVVNHVNHPQELCHTTAHIFSALRNSGALLLNQSVLLRNINDNPETLNLLGQKLTDQGVLPYYLHQLDRAQGIAHFEVPISEGKQIMQELRLRTGGYMVPRFVQEVAGAKSKVLL